MKVLLAMSGGVDSSAAAVILAQQGHDVVGVTMRLWGGESDTGCCSVSDVDDARRVAQQIGIDHLVFNFSDDFNERVVSPYVDAHVHGITPNPCIECNRHLKFDRLIRRGRELGFDAVATGHHARIVEHDGRRRTTAVTTHGIEEGVLLVLDRALGSLEQRPPQALDRRRALSPPGRRRLGSGRWSHGGRGRGWHRRLRLGRTVGVVTRTGAQAGEERVDIGETGRSRIVAAFQRGDLRRDLGPDIGIAGVSGEFGGRPRLGPLERVGGLGERAPDRAVRVEEVIAPRPQLVDLSLERGPAADEVGEHPGPGRLRLLEHLPALGLHLLEHLLGVGERARRHLGRS